MVHKISILMLKIAVILGVLSIIIGSLQVSAVNYDIDEDFSDPLNSDWILTTDYWVDGFTISPDVLVQETNYSLTNGVMVSEGEFSQDKFNMAKLPLSYDVVAWRIEALFPQVEEILGNAESPGYSNFFLWVSNLPADTEVNNSISCCGTGFGVGFTDEQVSYQLKPFAINSEPIPIELQSFNTTKQYDIIKTPNEFFVFVNSELILQSNVSPSYEVSSAVLGSVHGSFVKFDHFQMTQDYTAVCEELGYDCSVDTPPGSPILTFAIGAGIIAIISTIPVYRYFKKKRINKIIKIVSNGKYPEISKSISELFNSRKSLYFMLLGQKSEKLEDLQETYEAKLSNDMKEVKDIMHPFRLNILKQLHINSKMSGAEIKNKLGLNWSEFYTAVNPMEKKGYINLIEDFDDEGSKRLFIFLEEKGREKYETLLDLLAQFLDEATEYLPQTDNKDDLYPNI